MKSSRCFKLSGMLLCVLVLFSGCNRGALRIYGVGDSFPHSATGYTAKSTHPQTVYLEQPVDKTVEYYGKSIAGTSWQGTRTDTFSENAMQQIVFDELSRELTASRLFSEVSSNKSAGDLVLETEVLAFGAQVRGFLFARIGGVAAFKFTLKDGDAVLFEKIYEKVVRDNDDEYTGSSIGMMEDAMRSTMSDSYREVLKALFADLEKTKI